MSKDIQVDKETLSDFLLELLARKLDAKARDWLISKIHQIGNQPQPKDLYLTFSAIPRFLGKQSIEPDAKDIERALEIRTGLNIQGWTVTQAARALALCTYPHTDQQSYLKILDQLFSAAEVTELVALYSALPLLPYPEQLKARASEGIRTNMSVVFDAVVLNNPFPSEYLDEDAWNQMVLKALFMERPLFQIYGLEQRGNPRLSKMISNYAHERWVAGRSTSPEMWRPIGVHGTIGIYEDLEHLIGLDDPDQQAAAVLVADALGTREAQTFLDHHQEVVDEVKRNKTTWDQIGQSWWDEKTRNKS
jgi:hypothetical protein